MILKLEAVRIKRDTFRSPSNDNEAIAKAILKIFH